MARTELSFGDEPLLCSNTHTAQEFLDRLQPLDDLLAAAGPPLRGGSRHDACPEARHDLPQLNYPPAPRPRINTLYWPTGAARWAIGYFLADEEGKKRIVKAAHPASGTAQALTLRAQTGNGLTFSASMFLLAPRQVSAMIDKPKAWPQLRKNNLYILPLVDARYFWQFRNVGEIEFTTWADLYTELSASLGVTITRDDAAAAYLQPDHHEFARRWDNAAYLLDVAAHSIGQRIVHQPNGNTYSVNFETSATDYTANFTSNGSWEQLAGGVADSGITAASVDVVFPSNNCAATCSDDDPGGHSINVPAGELTMLSRAADSVKTIHTTARTEITDCEETIDNENALQDLAEQIAADWYASQAKQYDFTWAGYKPWFLTGFCDALIMQFAVDRETEYEITLEERPECEHKLFEPLTTTRVRSLPQNFGLEWQWQQGEATQDQDTTPNGTAAALQIFDEQAGCGWISPADGVFCEGGSTVYFHKGIALDFCDCEENTRPVFIVLLNCYADLNGAALVPNGQYLTGVKIGRACVDDELRDVYLGSVYESVVWIKATDCISPGSRGNSGVLRQFCGGNWEDSQFTVDTLADPSCRNFILPGECVPAVYKCESQSHEIIGEHGLRRRGLVETEIPCGQTGDVQIQDSNCSVQAANDWGMERKIAPVICGTATTEEVWIQWDGECPDGGVCPGSWHIEPMPRTQRFSGTLTEDLCGETGEVEAEILDSCGYEAVAQAISTVANPLDFRACSGAKVILEWDEVESCYYVAAVPPVPSFIKGTADSASCGTDEIDITTSNGTIGAANPRNHCFEEGDDILCAVLLCDDQGSGSGGCFTYEIIDVTRKVRELSHVECVSHTAGNTMISKTYSVCVESCEDPQEAEAEDLCDCCEGSGSEEHGSGSDDPEGSGTEPNETPSTCLTPDVLPDTLYADGHPIYHYAEDGPYPHPECNAVDPELAAALTGVWYGSWNNGDGTRTYVHFWEKLNGEIGDCVGIGLSHFRQVWEIRSIDTDECITSSSETICCDAVEPDPLLIPFPTYPITDVAV